MKKLNFKLREFGLRLLVFGITMLSINATIAQTFTTDTPPTVEVKYAGESDTYTYQGTGFDPGTTFIVYHGTLSENTVLGTSTTQDADTDIVFNWPDGDMNINVSIGAFSGSDFDADPYTEIVAGSSSLFDIDKSTLDITDVEDDLGGSISTAYPGDEIKVNGTLLNIDLSNYNYAVSVGDGTNEYLLENLNTDDIDNTAGVKTFEVTGNIPTGIEYDLDEVTLYAYEKSATAPLLGLNLSNDFSLSGSTDDFDVEGGEEDVATGVLFDKDEERSITSEAMYIDSENGTITLSLARGQNLISPAGTDLVIEYSTNGSTYSELSSITMNELTAIGSGHTTVELTSLPAGIASNTTQFRVRQEGNNGLNLDTWYLVDMNISIESNIISQSRFNLDPQTLNIPRPNITIDPIATTPIYPMTELTQTWTIDNGAFPAATEAKLMLSRTGDEEYDLVLADITDITSGTVTFEAPILQAGFYGTYIAVNGEKYNSSLTMDGLGLTIDDINFTDPITIAGADYGFPGSSVTVDFTVSGVPGAGAELMLSVYDNDEMEYYMIGANSTVVEGAGTITATLPQDFDYGTTPSLEISITTGVFNNSSTSQTLLNESWSGSEGPSSLTFEGIETYNNAETSMVSSSQRSITTEAFDMRYGGSLQFYFTNSVFTSPFDVMIEASTDGSNWEEIESKAISASGYDNTGLITLPNHLWSETTSLRFVYNKNGESGYQENIVEVYYALVYSATFMETSNTTSVFNLLRPSLDVEELDHSSFSLGETITINYNAQNFPTGTEYAAVLEQGDAYYVLGTSNGQNASSINAVMPSLIPLDPEEATPDYDIVVYPYSPTTAGGDFLKGETITLEEMNQFVSVMGVNGTVDYQDIEFTSSGERFVVTEAFDLSGGESATLSFNFSSYTGLDIHTNKNVVPRLEASTDGSTFQVIPVYELEDGEDQIYDDGLLYLSQGYAVEIPSAFLTTSTSFRFVQPLNLGTNQNGWEISNLAIKLDLGNALDDYLYTTVNNPIDIDINGPSLSHYEWSLTDLDDAVFNGEEFDYDWNTNENITNPDLFPSGTTFIFTMDETDPETNENIILGTTTSLGTSTGTVPSYVENGSYDVFMSAMVTVDGVDYYLYEDETVGSLEVFLRAVRTTFVFDENDVFYAGNSATFSIEIENDESNTAGIDGLFANLLVIDYDGNDDLLLATQEGVDNITVDLPPYLRGGNYEFQVMLTEGASFGEAGDLANFDDAADPMSIGGDYYNSGNFQTVIETRDFYESNFSYNTNRTFSWNYEFDPVTAASSSSNERMAFQYSKDGGNSWSTYTYFNGPNTSSYSPNLNYFIDGTYNSPAGTYNERVRFRWIIYDPNESYIPTSQGSTLKLSNVEIASYASSMETSTYYFPTGAEIRDEVSFDNDFGRGLISTKEFKAGDLERFELVSFDLSFEEVLNNMASNQVLVFEYSIDGGSTYTEVSSFPNQNIYDDLFDGEEEELDNETFEFVVTNEMKSNDVKFRFRQEERNDIDVSIGFLEFLPAKILPFDYISDDQTIAEQALLVTAIASEEACHESEVTLSYEVRGKFGAKNIVTVNFKDGDGSTTALSGYEFSIVEGTGDISFNLPSDILSSGDNNAFFLFNLEAEDNTYEDIDEDFEVTGVYSDFNLEVVAPILLDTDFTIEDQLLCDTQDIMVTIDDVQNYFTYQLINKEDGSTLGDPLTYDPEVDETEINIGALTDPIEIGLMITSASSTGTECNTVTSIYEDELVVRPSYVLYRSRDYGDNYIVSATGNSETICEGSSRVELAAGRISSNSTSVSMTSSVEWFRDNINTPVSTSTYLTSFSQSGEYFARVKDGDCIYTTETITITVIESPERPTVTVVSGDLIACEGSIEVVLEAPEGFTQYEWSGGSINGQGTRTVTVTEAGSYSVRVSNQPAGLGCASPYSQQVIVEDVALPEFTTKNSTSTSTSYNIYEGDTKYSCENYTLYFFENNSYGNDGTVVIYQDGTEIARTHNNYYVINTSGIYRAEWISDDLDISCTTSTGEFEIILFDEIDVTPVLTADGSLEVCEGESITLSTTSDAPHFTWYRNGSVINSSEGGANTITVTQEGRYQVMAHATDEVTCSASDLSNVIEVKINYLPATNISFGNEKTDCTTGDVTVDVYNTDANLSYQLTDRETGQNVGAAFSGSSSGTVNVTLSGLVERTYLGVEVSYTDGSGCSDKADYVDNIIPNSVMLEIEGNTLMATISGSYLEYSWYRNDVLLRNATGTSLSITDAASYTIEVLFEGGCTLTSNSVDLAPSAPAPEESGRLSVNTTTFPNPTTGDQLNVEVLGTNFGTYTVSIMSMSGQVMVYEELDKNVEEFTKTISVSHLQRGLYNLQIKKGDELENIRILKN
ncbi:T9SS type A sorting domain-containing protein [Reichenbachiella agariperforans]|uniref:T9SS type A sorting domain-containing protein n=1 Tax=Reichenbachiella agariperforans TaxID=156994 RepID=UPI001C08AB88|nr:T9SS type A sorting domain-containing protein [Reichenbachiella agariperforans]MBU2913232.1 T9SS type A sorting domain-containing protein [Reichenbachiella agariperforans]